MLYNALKGIDLQLNKKIYTYFIKFDESIIDYKLLNFISEKCRMKVSKKISNIDKKLVLYAELLLRIIICKCYGINNKDIVIAEDNHGKPFIKGILNFQFNISHSKNVLVLAISNNAIGIDVEQIRHFDIKIVNRFFSKCEKDYIFNDNNNINSKCFYIWTKKEAYLKYIGKGLTSNLKYICVLKKDISCLLYTFEHDYNIITLCFNDKKSICVGKITETYINDLIYTLLK